MYGGPTTLVTFAEDEAEPTRFRDLETGADFVDCVNTLATPLQDQLAQWCAAGGCADISVQLCVDVYAGYVMRAMHPWVSGMEHKRSSVHTPQYLRVLPNRSPKASGQG